MIVRGGAPNASPGLGAAGVHRWPGVDADELVRLFPSQARTLLDHALADPDEGPDAVERVYTLATKAEFDRSAADDLLRIATLLAPNLRWPRRLRAVEKLCAAHYGMRLVQLSLALAISGIGAVIIATLFS